MLVLGIALEAQGSARARMGAIIAGVELRTLTSGQGMVIITVDLAVGMWSGSGRGRSHD